MTTTNPTTLAPPIWEPPPRPVPTAAPPGGGPGLPDSEPRLPERVVVDCRLYGSVFGGWSAPPSHRSLTRVRGVTCRGGMHAAMGEEGQDAVGAAWDPATGTVFVAVADGLGSLPNSGAVAYEAVAAALHLCRTRRDGPPFANVGTRLFEAVAAGMRRSFGPDAGDDGGTTLVVAEVVPDAQGASVTVHGVGDSEAWLLERGRWRPLHHERDTDSDDNVTRDLPTDPRPRTQHARVGHGSLLLLATDGFATRIEEGDGAQRLADQLRRAQQPWDLGHLVAGAGDAYSDDRGVVAVWVD